MKTIKNLIKNDSGQYVAVYDDGDVKSIKIGELEQIYDETPESISESIRSELPWMISQFTKAQKADEEKLKMRDHCKDIAEEIEAYYNGIKYECPYCGAIIEAETDDDGNRIIGCGECCEDIEADEIEQLSLSDYFAENTFNIDFILYDHIEYKSVRIMVECGGPTTYIDTCEREVVCYWGSDKASYLLNEDVCAAIDEIYSETFEYLAKKKYDEI